MLAGCLRPTGDFGRARPSFINDRILPVAGRQVVGLNREPQSSFPYTDEEEELRDLSWYLVAPAHGRDWIGMSAAELQRTEITVRADLRLAPERYSALLLSDRYRSSEARYRRIMDDAANDMAAIGGFFARAADVAAADEARLAAAMALPDIGVSELDDTHGRIAENERLVAWVTRAVWFRLYAYRYALDRLMIATPSASAEAVRDRLDALEAEIRAATGRPPMVITAEEPVDLMEIVRKA